MEKSCCCSSAKTRSRITCLSSDAWKYSNTGAPSQISSRRRSSSAPPSLEHSSQAIVQTMKYLLAPGFLLKLKQPASSAKMKSRDMAKKSQIEKFRETAREHECDQSEKGFDASLQTVAKHRPAKTQDEAPEVPKSGGGSKRSGRRGESREP